MRALSKADCIYTKHFCEENIWQLGDLLISQAVPAAELEVVFISNINSQVAVFNQQGAKLNQPLIWDYHVILLRSTPAASLIYDFDSQLDFPCTASHYLQFSFPELRPEAASYNPLFRIIPASDYLQNFSSDRSHMLSVLEPDAFPDYPAIMPESTSKSVTLQQYWNFNQPITDNSTILPLAQFLDKISPAGYTQPESNTLSDNIKK